MADVWVPNVGWTSPGSEYYPKPKQAAPTPSYSIDFKDQGIPITIKKEGGVGTITAGQGFGVGDITEKEKTGYEWNKKGEITKTKYIEINVQPTFSSGGREAPAPQQPFYTFPQPVDFVKLSQTQPQAKIEQQAKTKPEKTEPIAQYYGRIKQDSFIDVPIKEKAKPQLPPLGMQTSTPSTTLLKTSLGDFIVPTGFSNKTPVEKRIDIAKQEMIDFETPILSAIKEKATIIKPPPVYSKIITPVMEKSASGWAGLAEFGSEKIKAGAPLRGSLIESIGIGGEAISYSVAHPEKFAAFASPTGILALGIGTKQMITGGIEQAFTSPLVFGANIAGGALLFSGGGMKTALEKIRFENIKGKSNIFIDKSEPIKLPEVDVYKTYEFEGTDVFTETKIPSINVERYQARGTSISTEKTGLLFTVETETQSVLSGYAIPLEKTFYGEISSIGDTSIIKKFLGIEYAKEIKPSLPEVGSSAGMGMAPQKGVKPFPYVEVGPKESFVYGYEPAPLNEAIMQITNIKIKSSGKTIGGSGVVFPKDLGVETLSTRSVETIKKEVPLGDISIIEVGMGEMRLLHKVPDGVIGVNIQYTPKTSIKEGLHRSDILFERGWDNLGFPKEDILTHELTHLKYPKMSEVDVQVLSEKTILKELLSKTEVSPTKINTAEKFVDATVYNPEHLTFDKAIFEFEKTIETTSQYKKTGYTGVVRLDNKLVIDVESTINSLIYESSKEIKPSGVQAPKIESNLALSSMQMSEITTFKGDIGAAGLKLATPPKPIGVMGAVPKTNFDFRMSSKQGKTLGVGITPKLIPKINVGGMVLLAPKSNQKDKQRLNQFVTPFQSELSKTIQIQTPDLSQKFDIGLRQDVSPMQGIEQEQRLFQKQIQEPVQLTKLLPKMSPGLFPIGSRLIVEEPLVMPPFVGYLSGRDGVVDKKRRGGRKRGFRFAPTLGGLAIGRVGRLPKGRRYTGFEVRLPTMKAPPL